MAATSFARLGTELFERATALEEAIVRLESLNHIAYLLLEDVEENVGDGRPLFDRTNRSLAAMHSVSRFFALETATLESEKDRLYALSAAVRSGPEGDVTTRTAVPSDARIEVAQ